MKIMKMILILCGLVMTTFAQEKGIQFQDFENWDAVLAAAKKANKPIFVDFFTTWCGPCKMMDQDVYPKAEVGAFFNEQYISVKVQMDKTKKDNDQIQKWYGEIPMLEKRFDITGYPTLAFVSPDGQIRDLYAGYLAPAALIKIATLSLNPGQRYADEGKQYYEKIRTYQKDGDGMAVVKTLNELVADEDNYVRNKVEVIDSLTAVSFAYFRTKPLSSLYDKDILEILGRVGLKYDDRLFNLFYGNETKVDQVVGKKYFARFLVDRAIQEEYFAKPIRNLDSIEVVIKSKYGSDYARRAADVRRTLKFFSKETSDQFIEHCLTFTETYGRFSNLLIFQGAGQVEINGGDDLEKLSDIALNAFCSAFVFVLSSDGKQIERSIQLLKPVVEQAEKRQSWWFGQCGDTYASLLYKIGMKEQAIAMESRVLAFSKHRMEPESQIKAYQEVLDRMLAGTLEVGVPLRNN